MSTTTWTIIRVAPMTPTMNLSEELAPSRRKSLSNELEACVKSRERAEAPGFGVEGRLFRALNVLNVLKILNI